MVMKFTGGYLTLVGKLEEMSRNKDGWDTGISAKQQGVDAFLSASMSA